MRRSGVLAEMVVRKWRCVWEGEFESFVFFLFYFFCSGSIFWGISLRGFSVEIICFRRLIFGLLSLKKIWESLVRQRESLGFRRTGFVEEMREETRAGFLFLAKFFPHRLTRFIRFVFGDGELFFSCMCWSRTKEKFLCSDSPVKTLYVLWQQNNCDLRFCIQTGL